MLTAERFVPETEKGALLLENIIEQIFEPQFKQISLRPVSGNNQIKGSGVTYRPAPDVGDGYYWVQPIRDLCAVTIADLTFKKEVELNYEHPSFLAVGNYAPPLVPHFQGNTAASYSARCVRTENHLVGYINNASRFRAGISEGGTSCWNIRGRYNALCICDDAAGIFPLLPPKMFFRRPSGAYPLC